MHLAPRSESERFSFVFRKSVSLGEHEAKEISGADARLGERVWLARREAQCAIEHQTKFKRNSLGESYVGRRDITHREVVALA